MSLKQIVQFSCPDCGHKQPFTTWDSLNCSMDPEAKANLLNGKLLMFVCDRCTQAVMVNYPLLYHDPDRHLMIWLRASNDSDPLPTAKEFPFGGIARHYHLRVVPEGRILVEKIRIFDAELDDRLVELVKVICRMNLAKQGYKPSDELFYISSEQTGTGKGTINLAWRSPAGSRDYCPPFDIYDVLAREYCTELDSIKLGEWQKIDEAYAVRMMTEHEQ